MPIRARLYVSAHQGQLICQCPPGPGYMSVPIRTRLLCQCPSGPGYYVSAHQGQVFMSVPSRARLLCQCPAGPGISAQQGQESVLIRVRLLCQCPAGPGYYVSAQQGQVSVPSRANSVAGVIYLRVTASIAVVSAPHQSTNRAQYPTQMRTLVHWSNRSQGVVL